MKETTRRMYFACVFALTFYVIGAMFVQSFVNYPTWQLIGADEFKSYHNAMSPLIQRFMVFPWLISIVLTATLLKLRPQVVPVWMIWVALIFNLVIVVSTALIQLPIQFELGRSGLSHEAIEKLIATDRIRSVSAIVVAFAYLRMLLRVVRPSEQADEI